MKTSEKIRVLQEIAEALENSGGGRRENVYDYCEWYEYGFDREKFDNYKESDENLAYHDKIADRFNEYNIREDYRQSVVNYLTQKLVEFNI